VRIGSFHNSNPKHTSGLRGAKSYAVNEHDDAEFRSFHCFPLSGFGPIMMGLIEDVPWKSDRNFVSDVSNFWLNIS